MQNLNLFPLLFSFLIGVTVGGLILWAIMHARHTAQAQLSNIFKALAADTLHQNSRAFLQLAEGTLAEKSTAIDAMVKPVKETLKRMDEQLHALEVKREGAYRELAQMVASSSETQTQLRTETSQLLQALRAPTSRGQWGEMQLQRILEMTGMSTHAQDFTAQKSFTSVEGTLRPDFVVNLPGRGCVIIDSKVPLSSYLDSVQASDEAIKQSSLKKHAKQVREHVKQLSAKQYWDQVEGSPELVLLFLPGEHFLSAALDGDADLMDFSINQKVVLATPMTLIALLRTVSLAWRQAALQDNVREIADLGRKLHASLSIFAGHVQKVGKQMDGAVGAYNAMVGSLEGNVLSKARQLSEYGASAAEETLPALEPLERQARTLIIPDKQEDAA